jgi:hypothetical protein
VERDGIEIHEVQNHEFKLHVVLFEDCYVIEAGPVILQCKNERMIWVW